ALNQAANATQQAVTGAVDDTKPALARAATAMGQGLDKMGQATERAAQHAGADLARAGHNADRSLHQDAQRLNAGDRNETNE
ncbi:MAG: hypothetical protein WA840_18585, partial [Caulobacteraceae bacterium]